MHLPLFPRAFRTRLTGPLTGLALVVGSALLLATFVSNAAAYRGDGPRYRDDGPRYRGGAGYGHSRGYGGSSWSSGPRRYRGAYHGPRYRAFAPIHHYYRPRFSFSLGLGFGQPYYYHPPVVVERDRYIYRDDDDTRRESAPSRDDSIDRGRSAPSEEDFDVTNEPPPGSYYHDGYCDRDFSTLDDYTEHLKHERHSQTIDILEKRSGDRLHTLEFVHGEWQPQISE